MLSRLVDTMSLTVQILHTIIIQQDRAKNRNVISKNCLDNSMNANGHGVWQEWVYLYFVP